MADNNRKSKRLKDLEYNVYKANSEDTNINFNNNSGCMTLLAGLVITILVCVVIMGAMQIGRNGPALTCAAQGCSNRVKTGSKYCWLHSANSTKTRRPSSSSGGSVFDKGTVETPSPENYKKRKIYSGVGEDNQTDSKSDSMNKSNGKGSYNGGQNGAIGQ